MNDFDTANQAEGDDTSMDTEAFDAGAENDGLEFDNESDDGSLEEGQAEEGEEFEEIEREGKKAKVPSWLKPELMMQQDYTRKTQELAEARRAFEAERASIQEADETELRLRGSLSQIDRQLAAFGKVDWNALNEADPFEAQKKFQQFQLLKDAKTQAQGLITELRNERTERQQQETARRLQEGAAVIAQQIKDWSPEKGAKLLDFGQKAYGFSKDDLDGIDDPRLVVVLHDAFQWREFQSKQRRGQNHAAAQNAKPAASVGRQSPPPTGLSDKLSADEWMRRRNAQLQKRG